MNKRSRVIFANFDRLERLLFWHILAEGSLEIIAIVTEADPSVIAEFFEFDSNHGQLVDYKITINESGDNKNIVLVGNQSASIQIISPKKFNKKFCQENSCDIIVSLDPEIMDVNCEKYAANDVKAVVLAANGNIISKKKNFDLIAFGLNHNSINLSKKKILIVPTVEATITALLTQSVQNYVLVSGLHFTAIKGPDYFSTHFDQIISKNGDWVYSRSSINNLVPDAGALISQNIDQLFHKMKVPLLAFGEIIRTPVTTAGLINFIYLSKKNVKRIELIRVLREESNDIIGFSKVGLVAQDVTSTSHLGIVDEKLVKCLVAKDYSILKIGVWYDYESSLIRNFFELILYISGLPEFK